MSDSKTPHWVVGPERIRALHAMALKMHGGLDGERNAEITESVSDLALQAAIYETDGDINDEPDHLIYVSHLLRGLACGHAFVDGNKRVGWLALCESLGLDDLSVRASQEEAAQFVQRIAGSNPDEQLSPQNIAAWLAERLQRRVSGSNVIYPAYYF